jgi:hypothetical protein
MGAGAPDALPQFGYRASPALACIIGARRAWNKTPHPYRRSTAAARGKQ